MASMFPAVLIGGPPHSGKSNLSYRLQEALRQRGVMHYLLRAHPDGEGNWFYSIAQGLAKQLRDPVKLTWEEVVDGYIDKLARDIEERQMPLLVDVGGKISSQSEMLAARCSHAVVIAKDPTKLPQWRHFAESQGLVLLAELRSELHGRQTITDAGPTLRGTISGLSPELSSDGICFDALVERVATLFFYPPEELERTHLAQSTADLPLNLEWPIPPLPGHLGQTQPWRIEELRVLLDSLPTGVSLGLYGRAPGWLYGALAAFAFPQPVELFDVRLGGWITPPQLIDSDQTDPRLAWEAASDATAVQLRFTIKGDYLERHEAEWLAVPPVAGCGMILDGRMPNWLVAALARHYCQSTTWIACFQPQLRGCVVIWSPTGTPAVGTLIGSLL